MALPIQIPRADSDSTRWPHTRAQLQAIARNYEHDADLDPALVTTVVELLKSENEDELKRLLKDSYPAMDDETVGVRRSPYV